MPRVTTANKDKGQPEAIKRAKNGSAEARPEGAAAANSSKNGSSRPARKLPKKPALIPAPSPSTETPATNGDHVTPLRMTHTETGFDLQERLRELVKSAHEQGCLTYDDFNKSFPEWIAFPD